MKKSYLALLLIGVAVLASCKRDKVDPPAPGSSLPFITSFESSFGSYATYNVTGDQTWVIDYSSAKMAGAEKDESGTYVNYENEDWLISSPITLSGVQNAKLSMEYIACYFNDLDRDVNIMVSANYETGNAPSTATWEELPVELVGSYNWNVWNTAEVSLDKYLNQSVAIAVKYISDNVKAGTIEIKSISITEGKPGNGNGQGGEVQEMPYSQDFSTSFGTYCTKNVTGDQKWVIDYSSAKMAGSVKENGVYVNYDNEDWLISSPVAITGVQNAKMTVNYIACYFGNNIDSDLTVWASTDYTYGNEPSTATWTKIPASWTLSYNWNTWGISEFSLDSFVGQTVTVAVKYLSTTAKAGTIEIKSISVEEGQAGGGPVGPATGDGSRENPYTANDVISLGIETSDGNSYWVKDYIVGTIETSGYTYVYSANATVASNLIISSDVNTSNDGTCVPVQLPVGEVRQGLNLVDNPGNYKQEVLLYGTLEKYFQEAGVKSVSYAEINGVGMGTDPDATVLPSIFSETFASSQGDFEIVNVNLGGSLTYVWKHDSKYKCMKASAYANNTNNESESWIVSPAIDMSAADSASLSFDHTYKFGANHEEEMTVWATAGYTGDVTTTDWVKLEIPTYPAGTNWTFVNSGAIDMSGFAGEREVVIGFRYESSSTAASTWEVKNILIEE